MDCKTGRKLIHDIMYVLGLDLNLFSLGQLLKNGYYTMFDNSECMIFDKKNLILVYSIKIVKNKMFPIKFSDLALMHSKPQVMMYFGIEDMFISILVGCTCCINKIWC